LFWNDSKSAEIQMKKIKELKFWIEKYNQVNQATEELKLAFDFYKEAIVSEQDVDDAYQVAMDLIGNLEMKNMLSAEEDKMGAIIKIVSGAGGTESQDWASMLLRMYQRWCERSAYKCELTNFQEGDEAGIKTATATSRRRSCLWLP
jgi:peptide chain release factor 2